MTNKANNSNSDYKALVQRGYDRCSAAYDAARQGDANPKLALLISRLRDGAQVLDVGCGAGVPIARSLAERFAVTGVDLSVEQIERARTQVPQGTFIHSDVMAVDFPSASFDAIVSFYAIFHLPREEQPELFRRIYTWLKPGGYLLATLAAFAEEADLDDDFFGVTMYWSNYGLEEYQRLLTEIGFHLLETSIIGHGYDESQDAPAERHPIIFAQKPA